VQHLGGSLQHGAQHGGSLQHGALQDRFGT
jgi:hypothetical protein